MNNEYLTTALIIAVIEMQKAPYPELGLRSIEIEMEQKTERDYHFTKIVHTVEKKRVTVDGSLPIKEVDDAFDKERARRVKQAVKQKVMEFETIKNGLHKISGAYVRAFNVKELKDEWSCTVVIGNTEDGTKDRTDNCKYPKRIVNLGSVK